MSTLPGCFARHGSQRCDATAVGRPRSPPDTPGADASGAGRVARTWYLQGSRGCPRGVRPRAHGTVPCAPELAPDRAFGECGSANGGGQTSGCRAGPKDGRHSRTVRRASRGRNRGQAAATDGQRREEPGRSGRSGPSAGRSTLVRGRCCDARFPSKR